MYLSCLSLVRLQYNLKDVNNPTHRVHESITHANDHCLSDAQAGSRVVDTARVAGIKNGLLFVFCIAPRSGCYLSAFNRGYLYMLTVRLTVVIQ